MIYFFKEWLIKYFKQKEENIKYYCYFPTSKIPSKTETSLLLKTNIKNMHTYEDKTVTIPKYVITLERKILLLIILKIEQIIKEITLKDKELICAYLEGICTGEGTAYCKRMKYIRIEMKNKREIFYISNLFKLININNTIGTRNTRKDMW